MSHSSKIWSCVAVLPGCPINEREQALFFHSLCRFSSKLVMGQARVFLSFDSDFFSKNSESGLMGRILVIARRYGIHSRFLKIAFAESVSEAWVKLNYGTLDISRLPARAMFAWIIHSDILTGI